jgi:hypothetical protein
MDMLRKKKKDILEGKSQVQKGSWITNADKVNDKSTTLMQEKHSRNIRYCKNVFMKNNTVLHYTFSNNNDM